MMEPVVCGPLTYSLTDQNWLSAAAARYALERLWAVLSGGAEYVGEPIISIAACDSDAPYELLALKERAISFVSLAKLMPEGAELPIQEKELPVLFQTGKNKGLPLVSLKENGTVHFNVDLVATTFFMLSRWEETVQQVSDQHGRFPACASVASRQGFLESPIVDEWALVVRTWLERMCPGWRARRSEFKVKLSHDVDHPLRHSSAKSVFRHAMGAVVRDKNVSDGWREASEGARSLKNWRSDPYYQGLCHLMSMSERYGFESAFYFMATSPSEFDEGYNLSEQPYREILSKVVERGHEVGLHAGYRAHNDIERLMAEKACLEECLGHKVQGGRHHYLRFKAPGSWHAWQVAGFEYDSTVSYADHAGFRCGTCIPYPVFDVSCDQPLKLIEVPLIVMEGTLQGSKYQNLPPEEAQSMILVLARRCQAVGGVFTLLWHNSSFQGNAWRRWEPVYDHVLQAMSGM